MAITLHVQSSHVLFQSIRCRLFQIQPPSSSHFTFIQDTSHRLRSLIRIHIIQQANNIQINTHSHEQSGGTNAFAHIFLRCYAF